MSGALLTLLCGVAVYAVAGSALSARLPWLASDPTRRRALLLLPLAVAGPLALGCAAYGAEGLYHHLWQEEHGLPLAALIAGGLASIGLLAGGVLLLGSLPRRRDDGGPGPDDLPPGPDPDGPDGWAEFERRFRAYAIERDARRAKVLIR